MGSERSGFVNVDALMREVSAEQILAHFGVTLPEIQRVGSEIRTRCFLNCGRAEETGDRAIAIQADHPAKLWRCFHAGCGRGGNLVSLVDYLLPGEHSDGRPRGSRFKEVIAALLAVRDGKPAGDVPASEPAAAPVAVEVVEKRRGNVPLSASQNERARLLVHLDEKFIVDPADMSPKAASYFRQRPFLTPEVCRKWRMGYLPRDAGGDHAGGTMRGRIVYPMLSEDGEVLTWFGRDPDFEEKAQAWAAGGKQGKEPEKCHFVKDFQRGLELFGQHRLADPEVQAVARRMGIVIVAGPNDVIALDSLGAPTVGLCGKEVTRDQAERAAEMLRSVGGRTLVVMFDCTEEGEFSARQAVVSFAEHCPVRLAWSPVMHGGRFKGREAASVTREEWEEMEAWLSGA
jgi:hypothetical protein